MVGEFDAYETTIRLYARHADGAASGEAVKDDSVGLRTRLDDVP